MVRCTFSLARAWRLAAGPASTRTLGLAPNAATVFAALCQFKKAMSGCGSPSVFQRQRQQGIRLAVRRWLGALARPALRRRLKRS